MVAFFGYFCQGDGKGQLNAAAWEYCAGLRVTLEDEAVCDELTGRESGYGILESPARPAMDGKTANSLVQPALLWGGCSKLEHALTAQRPVGLGRNRFPAHLYPALRGQNTCKKEQE